MWHGLQAHENTARMAVPHTDLKIENWKSKIGNHFRLRCGQAGPPHKWRVNLYYYRARHYNPYIGRFLQTDPIGYGDGIK